MPFRFQDAPTSQADDDPLGALGDRFRRGAALVDAASAAIGAAAPRVVALKTLIGTTSGASVSARTQALSTLARLWDTATIDSDNLLTARHDGANGTFVIFVLARQPSGALGVQSIEIDREPLVLTDPDAARAVYPFDRLVRALSDGPEGSTSEAMSAALEILVTHMRAAQCRLSIVKTRLDLQSSFLSAVARADTASSLGELDSPLNQAGAHEMALNVRRLLSRQSLNIANSNSSKLRALFEQHAARTG